jgi:hypothetical protein
MRYITLNTFQLLIMTLLTGLIAAALSVSFSIYSEYRLLPVVTVTGTGECIKVVNFQNGHAFSCPDKDVLLRRYRTQLDVPQKAP